jgi:hypothetical protein
MTWTVYRKVVHPAGRLDGVSVHVGYNRTEDRFDGRNV